MNGRAPLHTVVEITMWDVAQPTHLSHTSTLWSLLYSNPYSSVVTVSTQRNGEKDKVTNKIRERVENFANSNLSMPRGTCLCTHIHPPPPPNQPTAAPSRWPRIFAQVPRGNKYICTFVSTLYLTAYVHIFSCTRTYIQLHMHIYSIFTYIRTYTYTLAHIYIHMYLHISNRTCTYVFVSALHLYMYVHMYLSCVCWLTVGFW